MKFFFVLTIALFAFAILSIDIDLNPGDHSGHINANVQMSGN